MRWSALFDDLEARAGVLADAARSVDVADRARTEAGEITFADRLRSAVGPVRFRLRGGSSVCGTVQHVGPDWLLIREETGEESVICADALCVAVGIGRSAVPAGGVVAARLGVRSALRAMARDRATVHVALVDGSTITGTIDRVGADFLELAVHVGDSARRRTEVTGVTVVSVRALAAIRRRS